jgi:hypothetical protein
MAKQRLRQHPARPPSQEVKKVKRSFWNPPRPGPRDGFIESVENQRHSARGGIEKKNNNGKKAARKTQNKPSDDKEEKHDSDERRSPIISRFLPLCFTPPGDQFDLYRSASITPRQSEFKLDFLPRLGPTDQVGEVLDMNEHFMPAARIDEAEASIVEPRLYAPLKPDGLFPIAHFPAL